MVNKLHSICGTLPHPTHHVLQSVVCTEKGFTSWMAGHAHWTRWLRKKSLRTIYQNVRRTLLDFMFTMIKKGCDVVQPEGDIAAAVLAQIRLGLRMVPPRQAW